MNIYINNFNKSVKDYIKRTSIILLVVFISNIILCSRTTYAVPQELIDNIRNIETEIQKHDSKIEASLNDISKLDKDIQAKEKEISINEENVSKIEKDLKQISELLNKRARTLYMNNLSSQSLEFILSSNSILEFAQRVDMLQRIIKHDSKIINEFTEKKTKLETTKKLLAEQKETLTKNKLNKEKQKNELVKLKGEQQNLLNDLKNKYTEEVRKEEEQKRQKALEELRKKLEEEQKQKEEQKRKEEEKKLQEEKNRKEQEANKASNSTYNNNSNGNSNNASQPSKNETVSNNSSCSGAEIVNYASRFIGVDYVWGGTTPDGFDCSGLVQYCFRQFGIYVPRVAEDQQRVGTTVSPSQAKAGDLLFFGYPAHHVGFYAGNGLMLHAPYTGAKIRIEPVNIHGSGINNIQRIVK